MDTGAGSTGRIFGWQGSWLRGRDGRLQGGAKSERALRCAASRWGLSFGLGGGQIAVQLTAEDRDLLTFAAGERGVSSDVLMAKIVRAGLRERLTNAVLDDQDSGGS